MNYNKINEILKSLKSCATLRKKKSCFLIGTTKKNSSRNFFLTQLRESQKTIYGVAIIYDNETQKNIAKKINDKIDNLFINTIVKEFMSNPLFSNC